MMTKALIRRRDPGASQEAWIIHYDDIRVGSIGMRAGVPADKDQWGWSVAKNNGPDDNLHVGLPCCGSYVR
jgi:hypothetical protein